MPAARLTLPTLDLSGGESCDSVTASNMNSVMATILVFDDDEVNLALLAKIDELLGPGAKPPTATS